MLVSSGNCWGISKRDKVGYQHGGILLNIPDSPLEIPGGGEQKYEVICGTMTSWTELFMRVWVTWEMVIGADSGAKTWRILICRRETLCNQQEQAEGAVLRNWPDIYRAEEFSDPASQREVMRN